MVQPEGFIKKCQEGKVCELERSIYGLKQASHFLNKCFDQAIKMYEFDQNIDQPCVYKRIQNDKVILLVLYVDYIVIIRNDIGALLSTKFWLVQQFDMKDISAANYILGIHILRDRKNMRIALSQASYVDKILVCFTIQNSKKGCTLFEQELFCLRINVQRRLKRKLT